MIHKIIAFFRRLFKKNKMFQSKYNGMGHHTPSIDSTDDGGFKIVYPPLEDQDRWETYCECREEHPYDTDH